MHMFGVSIFFDPSDEADAAIENPDQKKKKKTCYKAERTREVLNKEPWGDLSGREKTFTANKQTSTCSISAIVWPFLNN